ncbi:MAG: hypothetical protein MUF01_08295 [Bryobacterales bacterium]|nr:hypothetical protein [Bryobacterales bacterium]
MSVSARVLLTGGLLTGGLLTGVLLAETLLTHTALTGWGRVAHAHKFYFSSTLVEFNPRAKSFEITVRLFADDLELVLRRRSGRTVEVDRAADAEALAFAYLREVLRLRGPDMAEIPLQWVGMETKVDTVYCYLEAPAPATGLRDLAMAFSLFTELQRGQVNLVSFRDPVHGRPRDLMFREGDRFKVVIFPQPEEPASPNP